MDLCRYSYQDWALAPPRFSYDITKAFTIVEKHSTQSRTDDDIFLEVIEDASTRSVGATTARTERDRVTIIESQRWARVHLEPEMLPHRTCSESVGLMGQH